MVFANCNGKEFDQASVITAQFAAEVEISRRLMTAKDGVGSAETTGNARLEASLRQAPFYPTFGLIVTHYSRLLPLQVLTRFVVYYRRNSSLGISIVRVIGPIWTLLGN